MKTYTLEIDGVPHLVFRAKNDAEAKLWESADTIPYMLAPPNIGTWTVRPRDDRRAGGLANHDSQDRPAPRRSNRSCLQFSLALKWLMRGILVWAVIVGVIALTLVVSFWPDFLQSWTGLSFTR